MNVLGDEFSCGAPVKLGVRDVVRRKYKNILRRHLSWNTSSLRLVAFVIFQTSDLHRSVLKMLLSNSLRDYLNVHLNA